MRYEYHFAENNFFLPSYVYASLTDYHRLKLKGWDKMSKNFQKKYLFQMFSNHNFIDGHLLCDFGLKRFVKKNYFHF